MDMYHESTIGESELTGAMDGLENKGTMCSLDHEDLNGHTESQTSAETKKTTSAQNDVESETDRLRREKEERKESWLANHAEFITENKKLTKAERRQLQNARNEANAASQVQKKKAGQQDMKIPKASGSKVNSQSCAPDKGRANSGQPSNKFVGVDLFAHLKTQRPLTAGDYEGIHPAIVALGLKSIQTRTIGASDRVESMLLAFKDMINDYHLPEGQAIARDLDRQIRKMFQFLTHCSPHSIPMGNAIKNLRAVITSLEPELGELEAKEKLTCLIDSYVLSNIHLARAEVVRLALNRIVDGDTILTFGFSRVIEELFLSAHEDNRHFEVVVMNCSPYHEGQRLVKMLANAGVKCSFGPLASLSYLIKTVDKVFIGATALFSNGSALARAGTAMIAMTARSLNKPVLVCVETHKFTDRVQLNSIVDNELGAPDEILHSPSECIEASETVGVLDGWKENPNLHLLNLMYDLTPQEFITAVITEFGMLPASSVPVIVREKETALC